MTPASDGYIPLNVTNTREHQISLSDDPGISYIDDLGLEQVIRCPVCS